MDYGRKNDELSIQYQVRLAAISVLKSWPEPEDGNSDPLPGRNNAER